MIECSGLSVIYDDRRGVRDLSLAVPAGQTLALVGPAGAGKSTLLRVLAGVLWAGTGRVLVAGHELPRRSREVRRRVGYLPQANPVHDHLTVGAALGLLCRLRGVPAGRGGRLIDEALTACGLADCRDQLGRRLGDGERARMGLAQAIVHDPEVLLLDEPGAGLEAEAPAIRRLAGALCRRRTAIIATRRLTGLDEVWERAVTLDDGRLAVDGIGSGPDAEAAPGGAGAPEDAAADPGVRG